MLLPEIPDAEESAVEACISPTRRIMDRRGPDFNRPRMCFISLASRIFFFFFFFLGIFVLPRALFYLVPLFLNSGRSFFVRLFSRMSHCRLFRYILPPFSPPPRVVSLSLRFVKETIMVRRERRNWFRFFLCRRGIRWYPLIRRHIGGEQEGGWGEWTERSPRPS